MIIHTDSFRYLWEVLERGEYSILFQKLRVLDLGCNVGAFSLWIYPMCEKLWAVDSEQKYLDEFNKTIKANEYDIQIYKDRVLDLRDFMQGHAIRNVDILKIDVEGDEYEIFEKDDFPKVKTIVGEYHRESPERLLTRHGYRYQEFPNKHFVAR